MRQIYNSQYIFILNTLYSHIYILLYIGAPLRDILSSRNLLASLAITERSFETAEQQLREALTQARKELGDK